MGSPENCDHSTARSGYTDTSSQQVHWRVWGDEQTVAVPALICCHPGPFSGLAFQNLAPRLARNRLVIAPDYPGYGGSSRPSKPASISDYAQACAEVASEFCGADQYALLGFHTGCLVAGEWARAKPERVRKLCLIDAPAFDRETSKRLADQNSQPVAIDSDLSSLSEIWRKYCVSRFEPQGFDQALAMFAETLRAGPAMNDVFRAAFEYDWRHNLAQLDADTLVIGTQSQLLDGTREVAQTIPGAHYLERLDIARSVLDEAADKTALMVEEFLEA